MFRALWIAKTGLDAQQMQLDTISNNLANVSTNGFKRSQAVFEDLLYQNLRQAGGQETQQNQLPTGLQVGTGVRTVATARLFTQGNLEQTGNTFDMAIEGNGFFSLEMPDGSTAYTRDGAFRIDPTGQLVTSGGIPMSPPVVIPPDAESVTIGADGTVSVTQPGQSTSIQVGQVQLATFVNPAGLDPKGQNLFQETDASGAPMIGTPGSDPEG